MIFYKSVFCIKGWAQKTEKIVRSHERFMLFLACVKVSPMWGVCQISESLCTALGTTCRTDGYHALIRGFEPPDLIRYELASRLRADMYPHVRRGFSPL